MLPDLQITSRRRPKSGLTLTELAIGAVITSLLIGVLMMFFSSGLRGSQRGMEHLNNMSVASILMSQIEYDLMRASRFISPVPGKLENEARWEFPADSAGTIGTITYRLLPDGIEREERRPGEVQKYVYCRGRTVSLTFDNLQLESAGVSSGKTCVLAGLFVSRTPRPGEVPEEFKLVRLITLRKTQR